MSKLILSVAAIAGAFAATPALAQTAPGDEGFGGFYVGGSIGYTAQPSNAEEVFLFDRDTNGSFGDTVSTAAGANAFSPGFCNGAITGATRGNGCDTDRDDIEYFARAGFDIQLGRVVVGLVGEVGRTDATRSLSAFSTTPASYTITRELDYNANLRARLGLVAGRSTLFYVTGGGAYARVENSFSTTNAANSFTPTQSEGDAFGFAAGGGVEQKIGRNFSIGLEYLYSQLEEDDDFIVRVGRGSAPATNPFLLGSGGATDIVRSNNEIALHSLRAVANFRF